MSPKLSSVSLAVMGVLLSGAAAGVNQNNAAKNGMVNVNGYEIEPRLVLSLGRNSNVGMTRAPVVSASFASLRPSVVIGVPSHGQLYSASYSGNFTRYSGSTTDNYTDHSFGLAADNVWSDRFNSLVNLDYVKGHDARNALIFLNKELWHTTGIKGMLHYGANGAQGQFELAAGQLIKRYDSNAGGVTQLYNNDASNLKGTFFYKLAPATQGFAEAGVTKYAYVDAASRQLDSIEKRYMLGVKWEAAAKTTGSFDIGQIRKTFNTGLLPSHNLTAWDAEVLWAPLSYSTVNASVRRRASEFGGVGSFIINRDMNLSWNHGWSSYLTSTLSVGDGLDSFQNFARSDKRRTYGGRLMYKMNRWLDAGVDLQNSRRSSTNAAVDYTQSLYMLTLEGSL